MHDRESFPRIHPGTPIAKTRGACLPHWTAAGAVYAVTFRLADCVPQKIAFRWRKEREHIVARAGAMGRALTTQEQDRLEELHSEQVEAYLDAGHGACHLRDPTIATLVRDALMHFDGERYELLAWCVMPNHVHVVVRPSEGHQLRTILHSWKGYTAGEANRRLGCKGVFWQPESYDHLVRDADDLKHAVDYVLKNPIKAGMSAWPWVGAKAEWRQRLGLEE